MEELAPLEPRAKASAGTNAWADRMPRLLIVMLAFFGFIVVGTAKLGPPLALVFAGIAPGLSLYVWLDQSAWARHLLPNEAFGMALICAGSLLYYVGVYWSTGRAKGSRAYAPLASIAVTTVLLIRYHMTLLM